MSLPDPPERDFLAYSARQDPNSIVRRVAAERIVELADASELVLAPDLEVQVECARASSFQAVQELPDLSAPARMREDQAEAPRRMVCGP